MDSRSGEVRPGSPLLMLDAMAEAEALANSIRHKDFLLDVEYFFVDESQEAIDYLRNVLADSVYRPLLETRITLLHGPFDTHLNHIVSRVRERGRARRALFNLDQYGYSDVPVPALRRILAELPNAEIVLTFAADWLIDYLGNNEQSQLILENLGVDLSAETLAKSKRTQPKHWRRAIQILLHDEIHRKSGAKFYTPFFIVSPDSHRSYWLVHLSGHHRAKDVMTQLHWQNHNHFAHYGRPGLRMLGYDPAKDQDLTGQRVFSAFRFDDTATELAEEALLVELPRRLRDSLGEVTFETLFAALTNESPATSELFKNTIRELTIAGELEVRDPAGSRRAAGAAVRKKDVIFVPEQKRFFGRPARE